MQIVQAPRASAILYHLLKSQGTAHPWLVPANICPIVPITFFKAGIPFEFVDISAENLHMDLDRAGERLERGPYGGVLYAHTYGEPSTPEDFFQQVKSFDPNLVLVDDRCLCVPDLDPPGETCADVALYSTGYAKIVDLNFGGYAFIKEGVPFQPERLPYSPQANKDIERSYKQAVKTQTRYSYTDSDWLQTEAYQPAWYDYRHQIEDGLKTTLAYRAAVNEVYVNCLPTEIQLPQEYQTWRFNLRLKNKEWILEAIFASGLFASSHYASLGGIMAPGHCYHAAALAKDILNLFNDHHFDPQKAAQVCAVILENLD